MPLVDMMQTRCRIWPQVFSIQQIPDQVLMSGGSVHFGLTLVQEQQLEMRHRALVQRHTSPVHTQHTLLLGGFGPNGEAAQHFHGAPCTLAHTLPTHMWGPMGQTRLTVEWRASPTGRANPLGASNSCLSQSGLALHTHRDRLKAVLMLEEAKVGKLQ